MPLDIIKTPAGERLNAASVLNPMNLALTNALATVALAESADTLLLNAPTAKTTTWLLILSAPSD